MDGAVIVDAKEEGERERHGTLSFVAGNPSCFVIFILFCRLVLLRRFVFFLFCSFRRFVTFVLSFCLILVFVVLYYHFLFRRLASFSCRFVCLHFVVFSLSLIRERRGALLLALNEESAAEVIAADSSRRIVFPIKIVFNFYLPMQVDNMQS